MSENFAPPKTATAQTHNQITHVIGVMSGKGGVGKSLVAALLAAALKNSGYATGILDADITGPSLPKMFGLDAKPEMNEIGISPLETRTAIKLISINLFLDRPDDAVIWRGPRISNVVKQFWEEVTWGKLDYLIVDLPPGTADVPLTVMQSLPLDGVIIVTSPQDLAMLVVRKAVHMCVEMKVPIIGTVQNMAFIRCPECHKLIYPFGKAEGERLARELKVPFILEIPIDPEISACSDSGSIENYVPNPFSAKLKLVTDAAVYVK